jgi:hypothetical protein
VEFGYLAAARAIPFLPPTGQNADAASRARLSGSSWKFDGDLLG